MTGTADRYDSGPVSPECERGLDDDCRDPACTCWCHLPDPDDDYRD